MLPSMRQGGRFVCPDVGLLMFRRQPKLLPTVSVAAGGHSPAKRTKRTDRAPANATWRLACRCRPTELQLRLASQCNKRNCRLDVSDSTALRIWISPSSSLSLGPRDAAPAPAGWTSCPTRWPTSRNPLTLRPGLINIIHGIATYKDPVFKLLSSSLRSGSRTLFILTSYSPSNAC